MNNAEPIKKSELVTTRPYTAEDKNFIYASWLRGLYYGNSVYSDIPKNIFMENFHKIIDFILSREHTKVIVSCLREEPSTILGYAVISTLPPKAVHWVFIKKSWRGIGLARDLIPADITTATHHTQVGLSIIKKKEWTFNPFAL